MSAHRFCDETESDAVVHTVEISKSPPHFLTFWLKGRDDRVDRFVTDSGLREDNHHDPKIYHDGDRNACWMEGVFPEKRPGWHFHWHKRLKAKPKLADFKRFREGLSDALYAQIEAHFKRKK